MIVNCGVGNVYPGSLGYLLRVLYPMGIRVYPGGVLSLSLERHGGVRLKIVLSEIHVATCSVLIRKQRTI